MKRRGLVRARGIAGACGLALLVESACHTPAERARPAGEPFIALERDFQGFQSWTKVRLEGRPASGSVHAADDAHEFINRLPPAGSRAFPVGTIVVKTMKSAKAPADAGASTGGGTDIFAMVKRGAGYNEKGTPGWEWFELRPRADQSLGIVWRGVNPPDGEGYGREVKGGCNGCHQEAIANDYVQARALTLAEI